MSLRCAWVVAAAAGVGVLPASGADPAAVEQQYRLAQRLAANGSAEAAAAFDRVVELDPRGPWADDALVDSAARLPIARWPEELGRLDSAQAGEALALLGRALKEVPKGDRLPEARYLRALLRLEPLPGYDLGGAEEDLEAVAAAVPPPSQARAARYSLGLLHERQGREERALATFQRVVVDGPGSEAAVRARVGLARIDLRRAEFGRAASWLEEAVESRAARETRAEPLRELAVRALLATPGLGARPGEGSSRVLTGLRSITDVAPLPEGGVLLASRRDQRVVQLDGLGHVVDEWTFEGLSALTVDPQGRAFVAALEDIFRLSPRAGRHRVASAGDYAPVAALAADESGGLWLLDRRGQRIGRVEPGSDVPSPYWEDRAFRLLDLAWDGARLLALDDRSGSVVAFGGDRSPRTVAALKLARAAAIAADLSGRVAIVDAKAGSIVLLRRDGSEAETFFTEFLGVERPAAIGLGLDGALHLVDEKDGGWYAGR